MCGRYYVDGEMEEKIRHTLGQVEAVLRLGEQEKRDVHPGDTAAVLTGRQDWKLEAMEWGLPADSEEDRSTLLFLLRGRASVCARLFPKCCNPWPVCRCSDMCLPA